MKDAVEAYIEKFGGFPYYLFLGSEEEEIINAVEIALETNKEIAPMDSNADY